MTTLPPSNSEPSNSFQRLHPTIQRWIWEQRWSELRDIQDKAIREILDGSHDVLIAATTAAGKTEAAFLPILTRVASHSEPGFSVLYVSPLKALINDQFRRLEQLCERMEIPTVRWHGDAPQSAKQRAIKDPKGIALITPESIEAMLIRRPGDAARLFGSLRFIVVDELHAFLSGPRGLHLSSLLNRVNRLSSVRARRVGLSATIGDKSIAAAWLNPPAPEDVAILESSSDAPELKLLVKGHLVSAPSPDDEAAEGLEDGFPCAKEIGDHIYRYLRGSNNLVFAGSRKRVEGLADLLREKSVQAGVPNEFFPHHGSLAKELREELEARLKRGDTPTTGIATTTLELGIDIGSVQSVAQIGAPRSLASLRQRLGRSGRRAGAPAILRIYVTQQSLRDNTGIDEFLRLEVAQSVAAIRLLIRRFVEKPEADASIATVVLHQILSVITQTGGARADELFKAVCPPGPLSIIGKAGFVELLRSMASPDHRLLEQSPDGTIMLGELGERLTARHDFYAIFNTDEEWRIVTAGTSLGMLPISNPVGIGVVIVFAGQRWRITSIDDKSKVLEVVPHRSGKIPTFDNLLGESSSDELMQQVFRVLQDDAEPGFLDPIASDLLAEGRSNFATLNLAHQRIIQSGRDCLILTWRGTSTNSVLAFALASAGLDVEVIRAGVAVSNTTPEAVKRELVSFASEPPSVELVSGFVQNLKVAKFDNLVPENLLRRLWAERHAKSCEAIPRLVEYLLA
jgi:ATP-dependent Lhr-like helicase